MTSVTIPAEQTSATTTLELGTYAVTATASSMITITATKTITQAEINTGATTWNLGTMEEGYHTFKVSLPALTGSGAVNVVPGNIAKLTLTPSEGEPIVKEYEVGGSGSDLVWFVKGTQTMATEAEFTVTPIDHANGDSFTLKGELTGYRPSTNGDLLALPSEYTDHAYETVVMPLGTEGLTLTVIVANDYGPTNVSIVKTA